MSPPDQIRNAACLRIAEKLRREIGLDAASVGSSTIERTVRLRMKNLGLKSHEDYEGQLAKSKSEWEELVESVVVAETWFFRDHDPFAALVAIVKHEWLPQHPTRPFRLLSLPCSSGEEPYSIAMALLDADIPAERFAIDAADLSARALARAGRGVYGKNSFRGKDLAFRTHHFQVTPEGHLLLSRVRKCVTFRRANILADDFLADCEPYDVIFCRNLLIYFDRETQVKALKTLDRLLARSGVLFVGPAELPLATAQAFVSANLPMAFACRRANDSSPQALARRFAPTNANGAQRERLVKLLATAAPAVTSTPSPLPRVESNLRSVPRQPELAIARQLADAGKLAEAGEICKKHIQHAQPSAEAYYLLGLIQDAAADPQALDSYRKALYLEPEHYETLLQMSLLLEKNGERAEASKLQNRLRRLESVRRSIGDPARPAKSNERVVNNET